MYKLKRYRMKKWKLTHRSQIGKLWIILFILCLICMMPHLVEKFQCIRYDFRQKQLAFKEGKLYKNSFQVHGRFVPAQLQSEHTQKSTLSSRLEQLGFRHSSAEQYEIMELSKMFKKAKRLDVSLGSKEKIWQKATVKGVTRLWTIHTPKSLREENYSTKNISARKQIVVSTVDIAKSITETKTRISLIKGFGFGTGVIADDQILSTQDQWRNHFQSTARVTKSQVPESLRSKSLTAMTSVKGSSNLSQAKKLAFPKSERTAGGSISISPHTHTICKPKTNIVFLKMHKSASSTVMNILFRYGENHNLTFALPIKGGTQLFYPYYFKATAVEEFSPGKDSQFNIMCHHMRFFQPEVARAMPNGTLYFSILRNPVHLMESSFIYYKGTSSFVKARSLEKFLNQTSQFYNATANDSHYAKNLMTFDFGFNHNENVSKEYVQLMLKSIEAEFDLVLISEYFYESMVLLKEMLCWDLDDVVSFPLNKRDNSSKIRLSEDTIEKLKSWNKLDWELYVHFNKTFWEKIHLLIGKKRMTKEVGALKQKQEQLAKVCLQESDGISPMKIRDLALLPLQYGNAKILGYNLRPELDKATRRMATPEVQYSHILYRKQFPKKSFQFHNLDYLFRLYNHKQSENRSLRDSLPGLKSIS